MKTMINSIQNSFNNLNVIKPKHSSTLSFTSKLESDTFEFSKSENNPLSDDNIIRNAKSPQDLLSIVPELECDCIERFESDTIKELKELLNNDNLDFAKKLLLAKNSESNPRLYGEDIVDYLKLDPKQHDRILENLEDANLNKYVFNTILGNITPSNKKAHIDLANLEDKSMIHDFDYSDVIYLSNKFSAKDDFNKLVSSISKLPDMKIEGMQKLTPQEVANVVKVFTGEKRAIDVRKWGLAPKYHLHSINELKYAQKCFFDELSVEKQALVDKFEKDMNVQLYLDADIPIESIEKIIDNVKIAKSRAQGIPKEIILTNLTHEENGGYFSSWNPRSIVVKEKDDLDDNFFHELGHFNDLTSYGKLKDADEKYIKLPDTEKKLIAKYISLYATTNSDEFIAEFYSQLFTNEITQKIMPDMSIQYSKEGVEPEIMEQLGKLYNKYKGPDVLPLKPENKQELSAWEELKQELMHKINHIESHLSIFDRMKNTFLAKEGSS